MIEFELFGRHWMVDQVRALLMFVGLAAIVAVHLVERTRQQLGSFIDDIEPDLQWVRRRRTTTDVLRAIRRDASEQREELIAELDELYGLLDTSAEDPEDLGDDEPDEDGAV